MASIKKPKKPKKPKNYKTQVTGGSGSANFSQQKPASVGAKPASGGLPQVQATTPAPRTGPPPVTTTGAGIRSRAESTYQSALRQGREGIVQQALRLGSPEIIAALKADPNFAEYVAALDKGLNDPTSLFAQSKYNEGLGLEEIDESANAGNTYFSGKRITDRDRLGKSYNDARSGYLADYNTNYSTLIGNMGTAKSDYEAALGEADRADLDAWLATEPEPTGTDQTAAGLIAGNPEGLTTPSGQPVTGPAKGNIDYNYGRPKAGYQYVQHEGSRAGLSYNLVIKNGKKYRFYENGDKVLAP